MKISVRKGLDINLKGEADKILADSNHSKLDIFESSQKHFLVNAPITLFQ